MAIPWYEWRNIRNRLIVFGRALQGVSPYRVLIEPNYAKCPSGYCNFSKREIAANPSIFYGEMPKDQYHLTKAILVHEAGHRRFTTPHKLSTLVHMVSNILEDERIERQMCLEFAGVRWLIRRLSRQLYEEAKPVEVESDSPGQVVAYFLQLRWANRIGQPIKGGLSPMNEGLWQKIEPLVYEAWEAETSEVVDRKAQEIVNILGLKEFEIPWWIKDILDKLGSIEGERTEEDKAEKVSGGTILTNSGESEKEPKPFDGNVPPNDKREGKGDEAIEPKPYIQLEERVKPLVQELIDELVWEEKPVKPEPVERGGKLSLREYRRDKNRPFLIEEYQTKAPATIALKVIIDHSTSLNHSYGGKTRMESIAEAVMTVHLVCLELNIPHEVLVTPQALKVADLDSGERGKALVAGLVPALCGYEDMGLAIKTYAVPMRSYPQDVKLVLCLTDGACNDATLGKEICQVLRGRVEVIGVLLDPDEETKGFVSDMFGQDRVIACRSEELPQKLGNILRAIRGV
ncbi:MAG: hypothetical protein PHQ43_08415 [Dehalococcoidales bacterium]|nr:hypothetical protein [Dehalococcoidales bacterium]